jgi:hypothetical protein
MHVQRPPYNDSILTITKNSCADPYVLLDKGTYYMTFTCGGHVEVWSASSLFDFESGVPHQTSHTRPISGLPNCTPSTAAGMSTSQPPTRSTVIAHTACTCSPARSQTPHP